MLHFDTDQLEVQTFEWGTLHWLANAAVLPGAAQTLGICQLYAGQKNPLHYHPNCEEILYVDLGTGKHLLDQEWIDVRPGYVVRIPANMKHQLINTGPDTMITIITFSSGERETVFLE